MVSKVEPDYNSRRGKLYLNLTENIAKVLFSSPGVVFFFGLKIKHYPEQFFRLHFVEKIIPFERSSLRNDCQIYSRAEITHPRANRAKKPCWGILTLGSHGNTDLASDLDILPLFFDE